METHWYLTQGEANGEMDTFFLTRNRISFFTFFQQKPQAIRRPNPALSPGRQSQTRIPLFTPKKKLQENENLLQIFWPSSRKKQAKAQRGEKKKKDKQKQEKSKLFFENFFINSFSFYGRNGILKASPLWELNLEEEKTKGTYKDVYFMTVIN